MLLRSSVKGTIGNVTDSVFFGRDLNQYPDHYWANSIHDSNNNNSYNLDNLTNLGHDSLYTVRCGSKYCQFQNKFIPVNNMYHLQ